MKWHLIEWPEWSITLDAMVDNQSVMHLQFHLKIEWSSLVCYWESFIEMLAQMHFNMTWKGIISINNYFIHVRCISSPYTIVFYSFSWPILRSLKCSLTKAYMELWLRAAQGFMWIFTSHQWPAVVWRICRSRRQLFLKPVGISSSAFIFRHPNSDGYQPSILPLGKRCIPLANIVHRPDRCVACAHRTARCPMPLICLMSKYG